MSWAEIIGFLTAAGYSQQQLADACDCSQSTISDIGNGKNADPRSSITKALEALYAAESSEQKKAAA